MKTIAISDNNWEYLQTLRVKYRLKSIDDLMLIILAHSKEAIKRNDLEIIKK